MSNLKRFLALTLAMLMVVGAMVTVSAKSFEDVAATDSYAEAVDVLSELGVIAGTSADEFSPETLVERQQMAMFIARLATAQPALFAGSAGAVFADQTAPVYNAAIAYASSNGFVKGTSATTFNGAASVTLQEAATMLSRVLGYGNKTNDATYPYSYMVLANEIGLLKGLEDVAPTAALTRGEVATMLYNALFAPKAERELLYTPDGQDWVVSIPDGFYGVKDKDDKVLPVDTLITKAWKATVVEGAFINATLKAGIDEATTSVTKSISDPVTLNKGIATTKPISFASLSKYFEEDVTADDMLGVELKLIIRNGAILKLDVVGSKTTTTNASYDKDNKVLTVDSEKYNLANYLDKAYPTESDNCIYKYVNNEIVRIETIDATTYQQIADGFFTFDVINEGLATQMLVYKPLSFGKVTDKDANGKLQINEDVTNLTLTTTAGAVKDNYVAYFNGGKKNVDVYAIAVKSDASKAVKINNTAKTATLANGTVVSTAGTTVAGATLNALALNSEYHVYTVDGKIISSVAKDAPAATYAPKAYYFVDDVQADDFAGTYRAKVVSNTGVASTITVTKVNGADVTSTNLNSLDNSKTIIVIENGTEVYTSTTAANFFTTFESITDVKEIPTTATNPTKDGTVFTVNGVDFVLNNYSKIVIKGSNGYIANSGKTLTGFGAQTLSDMVLITRTNKAGVKELVYLFAKSNVAKESVFTGAAPATSTNLYLFISENEITTDSIKYKALKLSTGAIDEVTYAKAAASIGANSLVYDVKSSDATPVAYTFAKTTSFKLSAGYVVTDDKIYTADGVKYYQWNDAADKKIFEEKTLDKFEVGKAYTGIIVTNGNNVDYIVVKEITASISSVKVVGSDGVTEVATPVKGTVVSANVTLNDSTVIGTYPVNANISYRWHYEGSDNVLGTAPTYTVSNDFASGRKLCVTVSSNYYFGTATWESANTMAA